MFKRGVLISHAMSTLFLVGVIWIVQIVLYPAYFPLLAFVSATDYLQVNIAPERTMLILIFPMIVELITAFILFWKPPSESTRTLTKIGMILVLAVWVSTFFIQIPIRILAKGYHVDAHNFLVLSNWIRTISWTLRSIIVALLLNIQMKSN